VITAVVSSLLGLLSGVVPDIVKEYRDHGAHKRELELLQKQTELQLQLVAAQGDARWEETQLSIYSQESENFKNYLEQLVQNQFAPTGVGWVDTLNRLVRPSVGVLIIMLFMFTATIFTAGVMESYLDGKIDAQTMANILWSGMLGESVQAVLGFFFGYRSSASLPGRTR